jgi:predicted enzyme related to lactoylglutathione lyase
MAASYVLGGSVALMGERTQYTPGTFSWADLNTTDQAGAKAFYGELFGWEITDSPVDETTSYSMGAIDGRWIAGISPQPQQQRDAGVPATWNSYITVEDADASVARARELGATVHAPAFDVMAAGRMAVIQDPQGAYFLIWQPKEHIGAGLVNAPGALSWNELGSPDLAGSARFYSDLFGWTTSPMDVGEMEYLVIENAAGHSNGGIRPPMPPGAPAFWLVYFVTDDIEAAVAKVTALGGAVLGPPTDIGIARIGVVQDPQGAVFALYDGRLDD